MKKNTINPHESIFVFFFRGALDLSQLRARRCDAGGMIRDPKRWLILILRDVNPDIFSFVILFHSS
jgi:hypothetical protein